MSKNKQKISLVVTDLDNTLFDWVELWYQCFNAMLTELVRISGVKQEELLPEIKEIFTKHHTSEYAFLIEELQSLQGKFSFSNARMKYKPAILAYRNAREKYLKLYPGIMPTLHTLKNRGVLIVGYTESLAYYSTYRLKQLDLDGIIDILYSPPGHDIPASKKKRSLNPLEDIKLKVTETRVTPQNELKPNPDILETIIKETGSKKEETVYVGDSLLKDISMAKQIHVTDVHAKYGVAQQRPEYELLREVTHWTSAQVQKEKQFTPSDIKATWILEKSFAELLHLFDFVPHATRVSTIEKIPHVIEIWKQTVDVQQHFNNLELTLRNVAISILAAILGVVAFTIKEHLGIEAFGIFIPSASLMTLVGLAAWGAFYFMDRHWYHRLLLGSVSHGELIETHYKAILPEMSLTKSIRDYSRAPTFLGKRYTTDQKMVRYYLIITVALVISTIVLFIALQPKATSKVDAADPRNPQRVERQNIEKD